MIKVIAEVGQAHDGSLGMAHSFIDALKGGGIDAVKFQTHIARAESSPLESFRIHFSYEDKTRFDYWRRMEFSPEHWAGLKHHCEDAGLEFISSPFSIEAVELLEALQVETYKIGSGCVTNALMVDRMLAIGRRVIISTGLAGLDDVDRILSRHPGQEERIAFLHCVTAYPPRIDELNLNQVAALKSRYKHHRIGYSDHSGQSWPLIVAGSLGAEIFEFHVAFDRRSFGPDSSASLTVDEAMLVAGHLKALPQALRSVPPRADRAEMRSLFGYALSARRPVKSGEPIRLEHLETKKPAAAGIPAADYESVLGRRAIVDIETGDFIRTEDLQ